jgi:ribosomal protein L20
MSVGYWGTRGFNYKKGAQVFIKILLYRFLDEERRAHNLLEVYVDIKSVLIDIELCRGIM